MQHIEKLRQRMIVNNPMKNLESRKKVSQKLIGITRFKGEQHSNWKGEKASYGMKHRWLSKNYGKASKCEKCHIENAKRYEWANISKKYFRRRDDFMELCTSCHRKYDFTEDIRRKLPLSHKGKIPWNKGKTQANNL